MIDHNRARRIAGRWAVLSPQDSEVGRLSRGEAVADATLLESQLEASYRSHQWSAPHAELVELVALIDWARQSGRADR